jgi:hypothetical protein
VGVHSYQVLRANRTHAEWADDWGWTYNHAPMLAYWRGRFYLEYLSNPWSEHVPPGHTLLATSENGRHWSKPHVVFPACAVPDGVYDVRGKARMVSGEQAVMHQRMGFYVAPGDRLLVLGFYGICSHPMDFPNDGTGVGRVVREAYADGTFGPIYFLRINRHAGWHEGNVPYPHYSRSTDAGFLQACRSLLADKLATLQWWEEDRSPDGFYAVEGQKALSYYHLGDGTVVGLWKWSKAATSTDEGETWSPVTHVPSLVMAGAKIWGQRTSDGRYALVYNPSPHNHHRWPLALVTGDGRRFDHLSLVNGEVPPRRFIGRFKDFGLNYVRGIAEGNGVPPDGYMWVTYSVNKEDIWVSRIPIPVRHVMEEAVSDVFDDMQLGAEVAGWNVYSPFWAPVSIAVCPGARRKSLELRDRDPYDYAKAERVFPASRQVALRFGVLAAQCDTGQLQIELLDARGRVAVRLILDSDGSMKANDGVQMHTLGGYAPHTWYQATLTLDAGSRRYDLSLGDLSLRGAAFLDASLSSVERIVFRTGPARTTPTLETDRHAGEDLPGGDQPVREAVFYVDGLTTSDHLV